MVSGAVVHTAILYEAVCHECGWHGPLLLSLVDADEDADGHACQDERTSG